MLVTNPMLVLLILVATALAARLLLKLRKKFEDGQLMVSSPEPGVPISKRKRLVAADILDCLGIVLFATCIPTLLVLVILDSSTGPDVDPLWYHVILGIPVTLAAISSVLSLARPNGSARSTPPQE